MAATQKEKAERFKALHEREGAFIIPNPWDAGSARLLTGPGFEALATTSAGFANSLGRLDGQVVLSEVLELKGVTLAQLAEAGVKRVSTGGALARAALTALLRAGTELRDRGSFGWTSDLAPGPDVNKLVGPTVF